MIDLLLALLAGIFFGAWAGFYAGWIGGSVVGVVSGAVAYFVASRRTASAAADVTAKVERHLTAGRVERAIRELEGLRPLARRQLLLGRHIDSQVGVLLYAHKADFTGARPYLERAPARAWHARAMLAADLFRRKRYDEMEQVFEAAIEKNRKQSLLYAAYAWCQSKRARRDQARTILQRGLAKLPDDDKLKKNLLSLQNDKKMNLRSYGPAWWGLHLEKPKMQRRRA